MLMLRQWFISPLLSILAVVSMAPAQPAANPYKLSRSSFVLGKTYVITITDSGCNQRPDGDGLNVATVTATGSGLNLTANPPVHKCDWTGTLVVNPDADAGDASILVRTATATANIHIILVSKAPGPVPPGLQPTVDVAWSVLPKRISSDNFGARVTKLYFPIQVVIGNNSGYDLQLSSIQFKLPDDILKANIPTDSYYVVRSSLQREQVIGLRNTTVNIIKAIGPILTGSTVFFDGAPVAPTGGISAATHHKNLFQGLTNVFSNPFEKGVELVFPDLTVQQLINLDNHTLRDGIIIANNTQVRTIVFVNRDFLLRSDVTNRTVVSSKSRAAMGGATTDREAAAKLKVAQIARAEKQAAQDIATAERARTREIEDADRAAKDEAASADKAYTEKVLAASRLTDDDQVALALRKAAEEKEYAKRVAADDTANRKERANQAANDAIDRANDRKNTAIQEANQIAAVDTKVADDTVSSERTGAASGRNSRALGAGGTFRKGEYDSQEVMRQLGSLELIGRSIAYLNRVSVISNPPGPGPTFTLSPASVTRDALSKPFTLTLTGDGLSGGVLSASDTALKISNPQVSADGKSFTATIDASAAQEATYIFTLKTPAGSQSAPFVVSPADIGIAKVQAEPIAMKAGDSPTSFAIDGANLLDVKPPIAFTCGTVTIDTTDPTKYTDTDLPIKVDIGATPSKTTCTITLTGNSGNTQEIGFTVQ